MLLIREVVFVLKNFLSNVLGLFYVRVKTVNFQSLYSEIFLFPLNSGQILF